MGLTVGAGPIDWTDGVDGLGKVGDKDAIESSLIEMLSNRC